MAKNRKPRKAHTRRASNIPMMAPTRDRLALVLRMTVEALILAPSIDSYNSLSTKFSTLGHAGITSDSLEAGKLALIDVCDRYERIGRIGVSGDEAEQLRAAVADLDWLIASIPANKLVRAETVTAMHCAEMGI
jgi:hypothetical protein